MRPVVSSCCPVEVPNASFPQSKQPSSEYKCTFYRIRHLGLVSAADLFLMDFEGVAVLHFELQMKVG